MPPTRSAASHEVPRRSRAGLIASYLAVGVAVVLGLGVAGMFAYVILGPMLGVEAY